MVVVLYVLSMVTVYVPGSLNTDPTNTCTGGTTVSVLDNTAISNFNGSPE
jgi:hypothetical protein